MRTTINIADNIYNAARNHAHMTGRSIGDVISEWANRGLNMPAQKPGQDIKRNPLTGFPVFKGQLVESDDKLPA